MDPLEAILSAVAMPGQYLRGALAGRFGDRLSGSELLNAWGAQDDTEPSLGGLLVELADPSLMLLGGMLGGGALRGGGLLSRGSRIGSGARGAKTIAQTIDDAPTLSQAVARGGGFRDNVPYHKYLSQPKPEMYGPPSPPPISRAPKTELFLDSIGRRRGPLPIRKRDL